MKKVYFFSVLLVFSIFCYGKNYEVKIVKNGVPEAKIVISSQPTKVAQFAAYELQYHIKKITGAKLPIVKDNEKIRGKKILVGESKYTKKYRINPERFKEQEYLIRFYPSTIILIGRDKNEKGDVKYPENGDFKNYPAYSSTWPGIWDQQGTLYATYDFLEKFCGVRWLNPTESGTFFPKKKTLIVKGNYLRRKPFFIYRDVYTGVDYESAICLWKRGSEEYKKYLKDAYPSLPSTRKHYRRPFHKLFFLRMKAGGKKCFANHSMYTTKGFLLKSILKYGQKDIRENQISCVIQVRNSLNLWPKMQRNILNYLKKKENGEKIVLLLFQWITGHSVNARNVKS